MRAQMPAGDLGKIEIRRLPEDIAQIREQGLLYLPRPYVVPGGRFNEMYGWDSYFIQLGLLKDGEIDLAKDMADNFLYEIRRYGQILNANRTYYLTRSQPPFLTEMLLGRISPNPGSGMAGRIGGSGKDVLPLLDKRAASDAANGIIKVLRSGRRAVARGI